MPILTTNGSNVSIKRAVLNKLLFKEVKDRCAELSGKSYQPKEDNKNLGMGDLSCDNMEGFMIKERTLLLKKPYAGAKVFYILLKN